MNINAERFFALTAMLAAPLVTASACVITDNGDDDTAGSASASNTAGTDGTTGQTASATASVTDTDSTGTGTGTGTLTSADSSGGTADATGDTTATGGTDGTTGGNTLGNCCEPDGSAGCEIPEVQDCVCALDAFCCETEWDANCAMEVNSLGCGECTFPPQAFDCSCVTDCDGVPVDSTWQVCGTDFDTATAAGQAACEAELDATCTVFSCDECGCSTAEVATIEC
jgi:hypothetical protein